MPQRLGVSGDSTAAEAMEDMPCVMCLVMSPGRQVAIIIEGNVETFARLMIMTAVVSRYRIPPQYIYMQHPGQPQQQQGTPGYAASAPNYEQAPPPMYPG